jgi:hypothetical protein
VACLAVQYRINGTIFRGKSVNEHKMCVLFSLQLLSEILLILRRIQRDTIIGQHRSSCKVPIIFSDINETSIFCTDYRKILNKFHESLSSGSLVVPFGQAAGQTDRQTDKHTDMTKLIVAFRNFAKASKMITFKIKGSSDQHEKKQSVLSLFYLHTERKFLDSGT